MKLKRSTVVLVGVALLMGAGVLIAESRQGSTPQSAEVEGSGKPIFAFEETAVTRLQVERNGETLVFEKDAEGTWQMTRPETSPAEPGAVAYLLSRLNTDAPLQTVTLQPEEVSDFGLADPAGTVTVTLEDGTEHRLLLGGEDFSGSARYAVIDPETWPPAADGAEEISALVVSQDVANGINRPVDEWKMPVEAATEEGSTETAEDSIPAAPTGEAASEAEASPAGPATPAETEAAEDSPSPEVPGAAPEAQPETEASPEATESSPQSGGTETETNPE